MPDLLTHYAVSLLIASRIVNLKRAPLLAIAGVLPDVDALLRVHRWATHSLTLTGIITAITLAIAHKKAQKHLPWLATALALYTLHIIMDVFTAPTPLLWPITNQAYMLQVGIDGIITTNNIGVIPQVNVVVEHADFTPRPAIEGPIISPTGLIVAIGVVAVLLTEHLAKTVRR